jgi:recombinational DNA repair ATPase RecF
MDRAVSDQSLAIFLKNMLLSDPEAYVSIFGPDKIEQRFRVDEQIVIEASATGEYWLTVRKPPGNILISQAPFFLTEGMTYQAKPVLEWGVEYV